MCVNSICAFLTHHPSIFDASLAAALACFLGRRLELFMEWSRAKLSLWISYRFAVVQAAYAPSRSTTEDGVRRIKILVCWLSSHPDPLLRLYLRSGIFNVVVPEEYWCKCGGESNYNSIKRTLLWGGWSHFCVQLWESGLSLQASLQSGGLAPSSGHVVVSTFPSQQRDVQSGGHGAVSHSLDMAALSSSCSEKGLK